MLPRTKLVPGNYIINTDKPLYKHRNGQMCSISYWSDTLGSYRVELEDGCISYMLKDRDLVPVDKYMEEE